MSPSAFGSLGLGVLKGNVYKEVLDVVKDRNLGPDVVTNQFVLELRSYVAEQRKGKGKEDLPPDKMTIRQACVGLHEEGGGQAGQLPEEGGGKTDPEGWRSCCCGAQKLQCPEKAESLNFMFCLEMF